MSEVTFTHANFDTEVTIYADQIFAVFYGPVQKATVIVGPASVAVPVKESVEDAKKKIRAAKAAGQPKERADGI